MLKKSSCRRTHSVQICVVRGQLYLLVSWSVVARVGLHASVTSFQAKSVVIQILCLCFHAFDKDWEALIYIYIFFSTPKIVGTVDRPFLGHYNGGIVMGILKLSSEPLHRTV